MTQTKDELLALIRDGGKMSFKQQLKLTIMLSIPAVMAQLSTMMMQYIDASMVGKLGSNEAASIGLVTTTTWLISGFAVALSYGFSVQIAHLLGSKDSDGAKSIVKQGLTSSVIFSIVLGIIGVLLSKYIPVWLGGGAEITQDAYKYLLIYSIFLPFAGIGWTTNEMLQASGNMKVPSLLYIFMCVFDVIFNYIFIFMCGWGVAGAALGTGVSQVFVCCGSVYYLLLKSKELNIRGVKGSFFPTKTCLKNAMGITSPMWLQNIVMRGAHIISTIIIAPLGAIAIAAHAFAIIVEGFCYMPGFGIQDAATTLTGQSLGAKREDLAKSFANITAYTSAIVMGGLAILMFIFAPFLMGLLSNDASVIALGAKVLRIEAFAEAMFGVAIAAYGSCVGAGDTLAPSILNFVSMWIVRIGLALILTPIYGLVGFWVAMCIELNVRGILFIWRLKSGKWMKLKNSLSKV